MNGISIVQQRVVTRTCLVILVLFATVLTLNAAPFTSPVGTTPVHSENQKTYTLGAVRFFEDPSTSRTLQEILQLPQEAWTPIKGDVPSFGFSNSAYWFTVNLPQGPHKEAQAPILEIAYPLLDDIQLFVMTGQELLLKAHTGDVLPFSQRPENHRNYLFRLPISSDKPSTLYLRVQTESAVQVPLALYTPKGFLSHNQNTLLIQGMYFGIILAMVLYNLFLFYSLRELPYLQYVLYTLCYFGFQGVLQGLFQQYLLDSAWWRQHALLIFGFFSISLANFFAVSFLNLTRLYPKIRTALLSMGWISLVVLLLSLALPYAVMVKLMLCLAILSSILILFAGLQRWISGHLPARIFTIAWSTILVAFVLASLNKLGLLPRVFWTEDIMQLGGVIEVVLLSIALGERINEEKRQRIQAEQSLSISLEEKVEERTLALNEALEQLESANAILDKMSLTDSLTRIANRRAFDNDIASQYRHARRKEFSLGLILADIDHFKSVNDTYGHQTGDKALQVIATILSTTVSRPDDHVYRFGGEEFAILLHDTTLRGALVVAEKIRCAVEEVRLTSLDEDFSLTLSAGVSIYTPPLDDNSIGNPAALIRLADEQLYRAKSNGRNRIEPPMA